MKRISSHRALTKGKRLQRRKYDPAIIERTTGPVLGPLSGVQIIP